MQRELIERITASLVITLISVFTFGLILAIANGIFQWDIFPPFTEKVLYFFGASFFVVIFAAAVINIMINISQLAFYAKKIAEHMTEPKHQSRS